MAFININILFTIIHKRYGVFIIFTNKNRFRTYFVHMYIITVALSYLVRAIQNIEVTQHRFTSFRNRTLTHDTNWTLDVDGHGPRLVVCVVVLVVAVVVPVDVVVMVMHCMVVVDAPRSLVVRHVG